MEVKTLSLILFTTLCLMGCQNPAPKPSPSGTPSVRETIAVSGGEASPKFQLTAPDGSSVKFDPADNPDNEVFLLLFWSYRWDPNVSTLLERTSELHERYAPRGLTIVSVSYDEEPEGLRKYLSTNPLPFEVAVGQESTYEKFKITSIPTAILVDVNGRVVERWSGYYTTEELAETISPHLPGRDGNSSE